MDFTGMLGPGPLGTPAAPGFAPLGAAPGGFAPLGSGLAGPGAAGFLPSPFAAPAPAFGPAGAFGAAGAPFAAAGGPFAAAGGPFAAGGAPFAAAGAFGAPGVPFAVPGAFGPAGAAFPAPFGVPATVLTAPPAGLAAERPVGTTYVDGVGLRGNPQVIPGLTSLLRHLEASLPLTEVLHSLHVQATQIPEIAAQPGMERFSKTSEDALHAEIAAIGFIRRMLCGDWSAAVVQGLREQMREANKQWLEATVALRDLLSRPAVAQHPVIQVLRQAVTQAHQVHRVAIGQAQVLGIAPMPEGEEA